MANQIPVTELVANEALAELGSNNSSLLTGARTYQSDFTQLDYKLGDEIRLRRQNRFLVNDGRVGVLQPVLERTVPLRIEHQLNTTIEFSSRELTLFAETREGPFSERYIRPAIQDICQQAETLINEAAKLQLNIVSGNPAAPINSFAVVDNVYAKMQTQAIRIFNDGYIAMDPFQASALKSANQNAFNPTLNEDITFGSRLGHYSVFDMFSNPSVASHIVGVGAAGAVVAATPISGASSVNLSGLGATVAVYNAGDTIYFTGVNAVNPLGRATLGYLKAFTIQEDVVSSAGGLATVIVDPPIISDPASPYRNVSTPVVATMPVILEGVGGTTYHVNPAYAPRGLDIVMPPLELLDGVASSVVTDKDLNVSLRVQRQGIVMNDINILRLDLLLGFGWHDDYGIKLLSL
jgi:hypothetical protein